MPNYELSALAADNQATIATSMSPIVTVDHYAEPLLKMIREFKLEDVPGEIARLKKLDFFNWEFAMRIPVLHELVGESKGPHWQRCAIHFLSATDPNSIASEATVLFAVQCLLDASPEKETTKRVLDIPDASGATTLHLASAVRDLDFVKLLVEHGASVTVEDASRHMPLHYAISSPHGESIALYLIGKGGVAVSNRDINGQTALHIAVINQRLAVIRLLLTISKRSEVYAYDHNLTCPLDSARYIAAMQRKSASGASSEQNQTAGSKTADEVEQELKAYSPPIPENGDLGKPGSSIPLETHLYTARTQLKTVQYPNMSPQTVRETISHIPLKKPVSEVLHGPEAWLTELRKRQGPASSGSEWLACWMHLPSHDLALVKQTAQLAFGEASGLPDKTRNITLEFIKYMMDSENLTRPGFYVPDDGDLLQPGVRVCCAVVPILDIRKSSKHIDSWPPTLTQQQIRKKRTQSPQQNMRRQADYQFDPQQSCNVTEERRKRSPVEVSFPEQSLDEYCYEFLNESKLDARDGEQVLCRYYKSLDPDQDIDATNKDSARQSESQQQQNLSQNFGNQKKHHQAKKNSKPREENTPDCDILVVSRLWVWVFGDIIITNYGGGSEAKLHDLIYRRCVAHLGKANITSLSDMTVAILQFILRECMKHEPVLKGTNRMRPLDGAGPFSDGIASESDNVAGFYKKFQESVEAKDDLLVAGFKNSIKQETESLRNIDDILSELAMIRRVQEDIRIVCMDMFLEESSDKHAADRWAEQGRSKRERLEHDAYRVRESLVTLLSLQQREVNTEDLISSQNQNKILFVFTAATVFFTPLSWVSSLMALNIRDFTPDDSIWSIKGTATASTVTVVGFVLLMVFGNYAWSMCSKLTKKFAKDEDVVDATKECDDLQITQAAGRYHFGHCINVVRRRRAGMTSPSSVGFGAC